MSIISNKQSSSTSTSSTSHNKSKPKAIMKNRCQYCVPLLLVATFSLMVVTLCTAEALIPRYPTAFFSVRGGESRAASAPSSYVDILYKNHESNYKFSSTSLKEYMGEETIGENNDSSTNDAESDDVDYSSSSSQSIKQIRVTAKGRVGATRMPPRNSSNNKSNGISVEKVNRQDLGQLEDLPIHAEFIAETALPTDVGQFRLRAYRTDASKNEYTGREPSVIYAADKSPFGVEGQFNKDVPIRIHDQCLTSEVFRSRR
jgi:hypothetical protein